MSLSFFRPTDGFFERCHPVTKILCMILAFVPPFFSNNPLGILPYFFLLFVLAAFSGAWPNINRIRKILGILFITSVVLWTFFQPGKTIWYSVGPINIHAESVLFGTAIGLRLLCFTLVALIFLTTTRTEDFTYGLSRLGLPYLVGFALSLAFRLTPLFMDTGQEIVTAQKARGLDLDSGGPITRLRRYVPIIVPILVSGLRRADQLAVALESKGFGGRKKRTVLQEYSITWRDAVLLITLSLVTTTMGIFHYTKISLLFEDFPIRMMDLF